MPRTPAEIAAAIQNLPTAAAQRATMDRIPYSLDDALTRLLHALASPRRTFGRARNAKLVYEMYFDGDLHDELYDELERKGYNVAHPNLVNIVVRF